MGEPANPAIEPTAPIHGGEVFHLGDAAPPAKGGPLALLSRRYLGQTLLLWLACFLALGNIALLSSWMTSYFNQLAGIPVQDFARFDLIAFSGGIVGTLTIGWLMDRIHPYWLIAAYFLLDAVAIGALGVVPFGAAGFLVALIAWNVAQIGGQTVIAYAFAHLPASLSSVSLLIQPLTAAVAAWLIFGEAIGPVQMAGGALLLWGIYLSKKGS